MDLEQMRNSMKMVLKESRYLHSVGVEEVSYDLAVIYGCDIQKACIAGILHDCAKNLSDAELLQECERYQLSVTPIESVSAQLLHAKVGAVYARYKYEVEDVEIINAILYHTTGRPGMTLLEKIIFTADYIEPYRKPIPNIDEIRREAYIDLDLAVYMILENTLDYLKNSNAVIDTMTVDTYDYYQNVLKNR